MTLDDIVSAINRLRDMNVPGQLYVRQVFSRQIQKDGPFAVCWEVANNSAFYECVSGGNLSAVLEEFIRRQAFKAVEGMPRLEAPAGSEGR